MKTKCILENAGYILKKERLSAITSNILPNTLVLENAAPYPGYHGKNLPSESIPRSIFLVLKETSSTEEIARISKKISTYKEHTCTSNYAEISIYNDLYPCIRIKGLSCFEKIPEIQTCFQDEGLKYKKAKPINEEGLIKVHKVFRISIEEDGLYRDEFEKEKCYFTLQHALKWEEFETITRMVKNNLLDRNFDVALGCMMRFKEIEDIVRVYDKKKSPERIKMIHEQYNHEIHRFMSAKINEVKVF
jgi:hypothetical protein